MKFEKYFDGKQKRFCWRFDVTICGQRIRHGGFPTKSRAEKAIAGIRFDVERRTYGLPVSPPGYTLDHLLSKLEKDKAISQKRTAVFREFVEFIGSDKTIVQVRKSDLVEFLKELRERNLRESTIDLHLRIVSAHLNKAGSYFPPLEDYRPPKSPERSRGLPRQRILSKEEIGKLFLLMVTPRFDGERPGRTAIRFKLFDVARLMLLTGARREEIMKITSDRISYEWKIVNLKSSKVGREHTIALSDLAIAILKARIQKTPKGQGLFQGVNDDYVNRILIAMAELAGLNYGRLEPGGWSLHDFRRTAGTVIENAGIPYSAVMAQLGHQRQEMTARYTLPSVEMLQRAARVLQDWCRDIDGIFWGTGDLQSSLETESNLPKSLQA